MRYLPLIPILIIIFIAGSASADLSGAWWDGFPEASGTDGDVYAFAKLDSIYVLGGDFDNANGVPAGNIAAIKLESSYPNLWVDHWVSMGAGLNGPVHALVVYNGVLYAGGEFTASGSKEMNNIAWWNGGNWNPLESGCDGPVYSLTTYEGWLIAGGDFEHAGGVTTENTARWRSSYGWSRLDQGEWCGEVRAMVVWDGYLVVAGYPSNCIGTWNGIEWDSIDTPNSSRGDTIFDLKVFDGELYVCGDFTWDNNLYNVARYDELNWMWVPLGSGIGEPNDDSAVHGMAQTEFGLAFAGNFEEPHLNLTNYQPEDSWSYPVNSSVNFNGPILTLYQDAPGDELVFIGGSFTEIYGRQHRHALIWKAGHYNSVVTLGYYGNGLSLTTTTGKY